MKEIKIKNAVQRKKFDELWNENYKRIPWDLELLFKNVIVIFKRHSNNEEVIVLWMIHLLIFFKIIDENNRIVSKKDLKKIDFLNNAHNHETKWDYKKYLNEILSMEDDLFLMYSTIKYSILSFEKKFINTIENSENYNKSIWYLIPYLTYKESPYLWFFQDFYFKKNYPRKFEKIRKFYLEKISKVEFPWEHIFTVVNNTTSLMWEANVIWKTQIRKKTYFSIYNKLVRKKWVSVLDTIWMRIIFKDLKDLLKYSRFFEEKYVFLNKKDYISFPKENGYKSLHYRYISPYRDTQIMVELQLRTIEIENEINNNLLISHFQYTVNKKKWSKLFKEVHKWFNYISKKLNNN